MLPIIKINIETLEVTKSGNVVGSIYFSADQYFFPDKEWKDFVVVILSEWVKSLAEIVEGNIDSSKWCFMEGPFYVAIQSKTDKSIQARFVRRGRQGEIELHKNKISLSSFVNQLVNVSNQVIAECKRREWLNADLDKLVSGVAKLTRSYSRH